MIATLEHVVVIFLGWLQPKKSFALDIFGLQSSKTVMRLLRNAHPANISIRKSIPTLPRYTPSLLLALSPNGGSIFMHCNPTSVGGHGYIIVAMDYFTKWAEAMPTYAEDGKTTALFLFNHVIARFGVCQSIVTDHISHFCCQMMVELSAKLGFHHENSTPYYPQANGQVEAINKVLKTMLRWIVGDHISI